MPGDAVGLPLTRVRDAGDLGRPAEQRRDGREGEEGVGARVEVLRSGRDGRSGRHPAEVTLLGSGRNFTVTPASLTSPLRLLVAE